MPEIPPPPAELHPEDARAMLSGQTGMADWLSLAMLVCAALGAMAFGILSAYAILRVGFALIRPQRRSVPVKAQTEPARIS